MKKLYLKQVYFIFLVTVPFHVAEAKSNGPDKIARAEARQTKLYCRCKTTKDFYQKKVDDENEVGARTGYVNKMTLYKSAEFVQLAERYLIHQEKNLKAIPECPKKNLNAVFKLEDDLMGCAQALYRFKLSQSGYE